MGYAQLGPGVPPCYSQLLGTVLFTQPEVPISEDSLSGSKTELPCWLKCSNFTYMYNDYIYIHTYMYLWASLVAQ